MVVVYDPGRGLVTGGGRISSPADACAMTGESEDKTGRANSCFMSKCNNRASVPTGSAEFQFQAGGFNFTHEDTTAL